MKYDARYLMMNILMISVLSWWRHFPSRAVWSRISVYRPCRYPKPA